MNGKIQIHPLAKRSSIPSSTHQVPLCNLGLVENEKSQYSISGGNIMSPRSVFRSPILGSNAPLTSTLRYNTVPSKITDLVLRTPPQFDVTYGRRQWPVWSPLQKIGPRQMTSDTVPAQRSPASIRRIRRSGGRSRESDDIASSCMDCSVSRWSPLRISLHCLTT